MHKMYALKDALCDELEKYADKEISAGTLEIVDTLAHALKNVNRVIEDYEREEEMYNGRSYRNSYDDSSYRGRSYDEGRSYARGRGRNAKRDSMGRYSRDEYSRNDEYSRGDEYDHMMLKER